MNLKTLAEAIRGLSADERQNLAVEVETPAPPARPQLTLAERKRLCAKLAELTSAYPERMASLEREAADKLSESVRLKEESRRAHRVMSDASSTYRAERDALWEVLRTARDPLIDAFIAEMEELRGAALGAGQRRERLVYLDSGPRTIEATNGASIALRVAAIEQATHAAEKLAYEPIVGEVVFRRLAELRASIPAITDATVLLEEKIARYRRNPIEEE